MKLKRIAAAALAAVMLAGAAVSGKLPDPLSVTARAETEGDYEYSVNSDGTVTITNYTGSDKNITIPSTLGGKTVRGINIYDLNGYQAVTVSEGIEEVFFEESTITSISLPSSLTGVEFICCPCLISINVDENCQFYCSVDGVLFSADNTILCCYPAAKSGKSFTVPNSVQIICPRAFMDCSNLTTVNIPSSVSEIGKWAFEDATGIADINIDANNNNYSSVDGVLFNKNKTEIIKYPGGKKATSYTIPDSVTTIADYSFSCNRHLTSVKIPDSVTEIGFRAFTDCNSLKSVSIPDSVTMIKEDAFYGCDLTSVTIPNSLTTINGLTFFCCESLKSVTIPESVTAINSAAFRQCTGLTTVTIPESLKSIGNLAFYLCPNIKDVYYGGNKSEWEKINISDYLNGNDDLLNATIHFAKEDEEESDTSSEPTSSDTSEPTSSTRTPATSNSDDNYREENEVSAEVEGTDVPAGVPDDDRITSITINPAFNMKNKDGDDVELDLSKISIKANEIYDEESLKRAEEALGTTLNGNKHYNLLDLTLLYNGKDFSNGYEGLVKVIIPLPAGHRDKSFSCFRLTEVNGKLEKQQIPGTQTKDSYIIYLEHFSLYALVADANLASAPSGSNPSTGIAMAAVPTAMLAAAAVVISKKKK